MTRDEYLQKKVEDKVNNEILPILQNADREIYKEELNKAGLVIFFYQCGRKDPLDALIELHDSAKKICPTYKEDYLKNNKKEEN